MKTRGKALPVAIYARISQDRSDEARKGVDRQVQECVARADDLGWTVADIYRDNDASAYSGKRRPEYQRMLDDVRSGEVRAIIAWHPDRLTPLVWMT